LSGNKTVGVFSSAQLHRVIIIIIIIISIIIIIIRIIKSGKMRLVGYVKQMEKKRNAYMFLVGKPNGKRTLGRQDVDGWIILGQILER
jgi:hypothetical protein